MAINTYRFIFIVAATALSLAYAGSLAAHDCDQDDRAAAAPVNYADEDRDGKVTKKEAKADAALTRIFNRYDQNGDGDLDRAEFAQLEADSRAHSASMADSDLLRPRHVVHPTPQ